MSDNKASSLYRLFWREFSVVEDEATREKATYFCFGCGSRDLELSEDSGKPVACKECDHPYSGAIPSIEEMLGEEDWQKWPLVKVNLATFAEAIYRYAGDNSCGCI